MEMFNSDDYNFSIWTYEAAYDALYVVNFGEVSCLHSLAGVDSINGHWCWGEDPIPEWMINDYTCIDRERDIDEWPYQYIKAELDQLLNMDDPRFQNRIKELQDEIARREHLADNMWVP